MDLRASYDRFYLPIKIATALAVGIFAWRVIGEYRLHGQWLLLAVLLGELITITLVLIAPRPQDVTVSARTLFFSNAATFYFLLISVKPGEQILPPAVAGLLVIFGIFWQIVSKLTLGRCFGLLPAVRGIVMTGPYRVVRHPIYFGYLCGHIGFLGFAFSWYNLAIYAGLYACQVVRILDEETLLAGSPAYAQYMQKVRWRLLPGVF